MSLFVMLCGFATSCTKTGSFHVSGLSTNDKSISEQELNNQLSKIIGKEIKIEKYGENLKVQFEGEPEIWVFSYDCSHNGVVNYKANTVWGDYTLQYKVLFNILSEITVTGGRIYTFRNGDLVEISFK